MERNTTSKIFLHRSARVSPIGRRGMNVDRREARVATLRGRSSHCRRSIGIRTAGNIQSSGATRRRAAQSARAAERSTGIEAHMHSIATGAGSRTVIPFEPAHGRMIEPPPVARDSSRAQQSAAPPDRAPRTTRRKADHADFLRYAHEPHEPDVAAEPNSPSIRRARNQSPRASMHRAAAASGRRIAGRMAASKMPQRSFCVRS